MQFAFTEDQLEFRDVVRDLLENECTPAVVRTAWENDSGRTVGVWHKLVEMGVVGCTASEGHGGLGMDDLDLVLILEETGRFCLPEPLVEATAVGIPLLEELGARADVVQATASGESVLTVGLASEPFVANAHVADHLILEAGDGSLHVVGQDDVALTPQKSVDRSRRLFEVAWTPSDATSVAQGEPAAAAVSRAYNRFATAHAAQLVGIGRHLLDTTVEYATDRHQFGRPIGSQQSIKHKLANVAIALAFAAPVVHRAAYSLSRGAALVDEFAGETGDAHCSMAKSMAAEAAGLAAAEALQCHGAIAYTFEYDLQLWMKLAWALQRTYGDARAHRDRVAQEILD